jgi:hypothetical protein
MGIEEKNGCSGKLNNIHLQIFPFGYKLFAFIRL